MSRSFFGRGGFTSTGRMEEGAYWDQVQVNPVFSVLFCSHWVLGVFCAFTVFLKIVFLAVWQATLFSILYYTGAGSYEVESGQMKWVLVKMKLKLETDNNGAGMAERLQVFTPTNPPQQMIYINMAAGYKFDWNKNLCFFWPLCKWENKSVKTINHLLVGLQKKYFATILIINYFCNFECKN